MDRTHCYAVAGMWSLIFSAVTIVGRSVLARSVPGMANALAA